MARHPNRHAFAQKRAEREKLGHGPVDPAIVNHRGAPGHELGELGMEREALGLLQEGVAQGVDALQGDRGVHEGVRSVLVDLLGVRALEPAMTLRIGARDLARIGAALPGFLGLQEDRLQALLVVNQRLVGLLEGDVAATDQGLGVELAHRALGLDQAVHQRLGH